MIGFVGWADEGDPTIRAEPIYLITSQVRCRDHENDQR